MVEKVLHTVLYLRRTEMDFKKKKKKVIEQTGVRNHTCPEMQCTCSSLHENKKV